MPPKPKFTRDEIIDAALSIVSEKGDEALTAQELKSALNSSASPIFTVFESMNELRDEVREAAMRHFESMLPEAAEDMPRFKQIGMNMVLFGMREPKLYRLLFMRENADALSFDDVFGQLGATAQLCMEAVQRDYALSEGAAYFLFENMWIYTFGVGTMCAVGMCRFSEEVLGSMLSDEFEALMLLVRSREAKQKKVN